jgi:hypothetical protein
MFGNELSAVQCAGNGMAVRALVDRVLAVGMGLALGGLGLLPWLWLRLVRVPARRARWLSLTASDLWGHDPRLTVALSATGQVLSLPWQWRLAGPLLRGKLAVLGPRPWTMGRIDVPREPGDVLGFWRSEPRAPGLAGDWSHERGQNGLAAWLSTWRQLWQNPGGFGVLGASLDDSDNNKIDRVDPESRPQQSPTSTDPDAVGNGSPSG